MIQVRVVGLAVDSGSQPLILLKPIILNARPSDSIALAARVDAPIWVADEVLAEAGIVDEREGPHEDEEAKLAEFKRFLEDVDPEDFQG